MSKKKETNPKKTSKTKSYKKPYEDALKTIDKLKKQHEIDVNGYGNKIVEQTKMIEQLNKTINEMSIVVNDNFMTIAHFDQVTKANNYLNGLANKEIHKIQKVNDNHYVLKVKL